MPHDTFAYWRRTDPVHWTEQADGPGYWAVTGYDEFVVANRDAQTFSSERGGVFMFELEEEILASQRLLMLMMDPPRHTRYRLLVARAFTPARIRDLESFIHRAARSIVAALTDRPDIDFVTDVAAELPLQVIAEMMGVPHEDRHLIFSWSNTMIGADDPEFAVAPDAPQAAMAELFTYCDALAAERRARPREDILSNLVTAEVDGNRLSDLEINMFFLLLAVAGNETTRNLISGGMVALLENPTQFAALRADSELLSTAVEEMLRYVSPVMYFRRTATCDTKLGERDIRAGENVVLWYAAANRDESVFQDPQAFDITRNPNPHVAFGGRGPHFCLGANLARSEIAQIYAALIESELDFTFAGPPERLRSNFINGVKHLPLTLRHC